MINEENKIRLNLMLIKKKIFSHISSLKIKISIVDGVKQLLTEMGLN
jgi:hypothetical protein